MLLGFKKRFIEPIQIGTKVFTMRNEPKRMPKIGEQLFMYSGLRTIHCQKITDKEKLQSIQTVRLTINKVIRYQEGLIWLIRIQVDGRLLSKDEINEFVRFDGFADINDFCTFWVSENNKKRKKKSNRVGAFVKLFHWTDLKY